MKYVFNVTAQVQKRVAIEAKSEEEAKLLFDEFAMSGIYFNQIKENSLKADFYPIINGVEVKSMPKLTHPSRFGLVDTPIDWTK